MPSAEHLKEKQVVIDEIRGKFDRAQSAVIIDYIGVTVEEADAMRKKLREADVDYTVYKNTLIKRAVEGTKYVKLQDVLSGPSALAFSYMDAVAPARVLSGIFRDYKKMEFKAGVIEGTYFDAEGLKQIASLPSRDELIAKFLGSIQSPVSKLVRTFKALADSRSDGAPVKTDDAVPAKAAAPAADEAAPAKAAAPAVADAAPAKAEPPAAAEAAPAEAAASAAAETAPAEVAAPAAAETAPAEVAASAAAEAAPAEAAAPAAAEAAPAEAAAPETASKE